MGGADAVSPVIAASALGSMAPSEDLHRDLLPGSSSSTWLHGGDLEPSIALWETTDLETPCPLRVMNASASPCHRVTKAREASAGFSGLRNHEWEFVEPLLPITWPTPFASRAARPRPTAARPKW